MRRQPEDSNLQFHDWFIRSQTNLQLKNKSTNINWGKLKLIYFKKQRDRRWNIKIEMGDYLMSQDKETNQKNSIFKALKSVLKKIIYTKD